MVKINELASVLTEKYGLTVAEASEFIATMFDIVKDELIAAQGASVKIRGLGTFKMASLSARASVDVNTGERIIIDGRNRISFSPEVMLRDRVNRPFLQFETVPLNDGVDFSAVDNEDVVQCEYAENKTQQTEPSEQDLDELSIEKKEQQETEQVLDVEQNIVEENHEQLHASIECKQKNPRISYWLSIMSFILLVALGFGLYIIYQRIETRNLAIEQLQKNIAVRKTELARQVNVTKKKDTLPIKLVDARETIQNDSTQSNAVKTAATDYNFDARVRTGAYVIVGTDKIVTVKPGQTLSSISKTYLGDSMECYVEVYNGCSEVKSGDKLKIPQLKLKKRR